MQKVLIILSTIVLVSVLIIGVIFLKSQDFNYGVLVSVFLNRSNVQPVRITGNAMLPNYRDGQSWIVDKIIYIKTDPQRGDVVTFKDIADPNKTYAKRIIGLSGEELEIKAGAVYINNQVLSELYLSKDTVTDSRSYPLPNQKIIPQGSYFILGDNRTGSEDSRNYGFISKENIIGKLTTCYNNCTN